MTGVCLPKADVTNADEEYAVFARFGHIDDNVDNTGYLQIGWTRIEPLVNNSVDMNGYLIIAQRVPPHNGWATCHVIITFV